MFETRNKRIEIGFLFYLSTTWHNFIRLDIGDDYKIILNYYYCVKPFYCKQSN